MAIDTLMRTGCLTAEGVRFIGLLQAQSQALADEPVPGQADQIAMEVALDHQLTWQIRHLATAAEAGREPCGRLQPRSAFPGRDRPEAGIQEDVRKLGSSVRSRLLNHELPGPGPISRAVRSGSAPAEPSRTACCSGRTTEAAVQAYRDLIAGSADPQPDAWIGLGLALHQLPASPLRNAFATQLPVMFEVHACLGDHGDPLDLASWLA